MACSRAKPYKRKLKSRARAAAAPASGGGGMTPEVAALIRTRAPDAATRVWEIVSALCPTWHLAGEERQVHFGENFVDPPDFALNLFKTMAWLRRAPANELSAKLDLPACRADLYYLLKLGVVLDSMDSR